MKSLLKSFKHKGCILMRNLNLVHIQVIIPYIDILKSFGFNSKRESKKSQRYYEKISILRRKIKNSTKFND